MGRCTYLGAFIASRLMSVQVVDVVLVHFAQFGSHITNFASEFVAEIMNLFSNFGLDNINFSGYLGQTVLKPLGIDF